MSVVRTPVKLIRFDKCVEFRVHKYTIIDKSALVI